MRAGGQSCCLTTRLADRGPRCSLSQRSPLADIAVRVPGRSTRSLAVIESSAYNFAVSSQFDDLTKRIRELPVGEKAALVRVLIDDLDPGQDPDVEKLWLEEAERRYAQYLRGEVEAIPGDEVMAEARKRLK